MYWPEAIAQNLIASFLAVVFGLAFTHFVKDRIDTRRYGGWSVRVIATECNADTGVSEVKTKVDRPISIPKAKSILSETADLSVFLKGVVSPYATLYCDLIDEGNKKPEEKVLQRNGRTFIINLDNNKRPSGLGSNNGLVR